MNAQIQVSLLVHSPPREPFFFFSNGLPPSPSLRVTWPNLAAMHAERQAGIEGMGPRGGRMEGVAASQDGVTKGAQKRYQTTPFLGNLPNLCNGVRILPDEHRGVGPRVRDKCDTVTVPGK